MSDDWDDDASPSQRNELDREWDLRREQYYNVSRLCYTSTFWTTSKISNTVTKQKHCKQTHRVDIEKV